MSKKKSLGVLIFSLFILSLNVYIVSSPPQTLVRVRFVDSGQTYLVDPLKGPGTSVTFDVTVTDVIDLYGFGLKIRWAGAILDVISITEGPMLQKDGGTTFFTPKFFNDVADPAGFDNYLLIVNTRLAEPFGVDTDTPGVPEVLATVTFQVETTGESAFQFYEVSLYDSEDGEIPHDLEDGYFANLTWADKGYPGDVDGDFDVDLEDLMIIARAMGTDPSYPAGTGWHQWNPDADVNDDLEVDVFDLIMVGTNYGQPWY